MPRLTKKKTAQPAGPDFLPNLFRIASLAARHKAIDLRAYDVRELTVMADVFLVCSAASEPQLRAIFNEVREGMKEAGKAPLHAEGAFDGGWLILDYGSIVFHLFRVEAREFYDLDGLWGDAPLVELDVE